MIIIIKPIDIDTFDAVIGVSGVKDLIIEGNGARLIAKDALACRKGYFLKIEKFSNLTVSNLSLVHDPLPFVQGKIVDVDQSNNRTELNWKRV